MAKKNIKKNIRLEKLSDTEVERLASGSYNRIAAEMRNLNGVPLVSMMMKSNYDALNVFEDELGHYREYLEEIKRRHELWQNENEQESTY